MPREGEMYTAEEWREMFLDESYVRQLVISRKVLETADEATRCLIMNHDGAMYFAQHHRCPAKDYGSRRANKLMRGKR